LWRVGSASFLCWIVLDGNMRWDGHEYDLNDRRLPRVR